MHMRRDTIARVMACFAGSSNRIDPKRLWLPILLAVIALAVGVSHARLADLAALLSLGALIHAAAVSQWGRPGGAPTAPSPQTAQGTPAPPGPQWSLMFIKAEFTQDSWQGERLAGHCSLVPALASGGALVAGCACVYTLLAAGPVSVCKRPCSSSCPVD